MAQAAVERMRRQEDRSATGTPLFLFPFSSPPSATFNTAQQVGDIFQQRAIKSHFPFKGRLKRSQTSLEGSLKNAFSDEELHFLNDKQLRVICGSKAAPVFLLRGAP